MSKKRKRAKGRPTEGGCANVVWTHVFLVGAFSSLVVATPMLPGEASADMGIGVPLATAWIVLTTVWFAVALLYPQHHTSRGDWVLAAVIALIACHVASALIMGRNGDFRAALNSMWVWVGLAAVYFLTRQLIRSRVEQNALVVVLIGAAVMFSLHGVHQRFVTMPATVNEFMEASEEEKQQVLTANNLDPNPDSPERSHFVARLQSTDIFSAFSLANSLAGYLAPVLILVVMIGWSSVVSREQHLAASIGLGVCGVLVAACLLMTGSRSAHLAIAGGVGLVFLFGGRRRWIDWRIAAGLGVAVGLVGVFVVIWGPRDAPVVGAAIKSASYRFEYWQATAAMIADYPLWGCSPGCFQDYYTAYKLPQASETVADPHNFVLEIWATAGTPALLALFALATVFTWRLTGGAPAAASNAPSDSTSPTSDSPSETESLAAWAIYLGAAMGVLLAFAAGALTNLLPDARLVVAAVLAGVCVAPLLGWARRGALPASAPVIALVVLLVNLLAAGGISYPNVAINGWLCLALAINLVDPSREDSDTTPRAWIPQTTPVRWATFGFGVLCVLSAWLTAYAPLRARTMYANPLVNMPGNAEPILRSVTDTDPLWDDPWVRICYSHHSRWLGGGGQIAKSRFDEAVEDLYRRNQQSFSHRRQVGDWQLNAYRYLDDPQSLNEAIKAYREAVERYPNHAGLNAQLAWTLHLAGDAGAAELADRALNLDAQHPHVEQKLNKLRLTDFAPANNEQPPHPGSLDPEQWMRRLRKVKDSDASEPSGESAGDPK